MSLSILQFGSILLAAMITMGIGLMSVVMLLRQQRGQQREMQRVFEQLDLVRTDLIMLSEQVDRAVPVTGHVPVAQQTPEFSRQPQMNSSAPRAYEIAARLARSGASCDELMSACGLSRHEAGLLLRLHPQAKAPTAAVKELTRPRLSVAG